LTRPSALSQKPTGVTIITPSLASRFAPALAAHAGGPFLANGITRAALALHDEAPLSVVWAPFDHLAPGARLVIVGITPGAQQAENALGAFRQALAAGASEAEALRLAKSAASFSGPMRNTLVSMLDLVGAPAALGARTAAEFFEPGFEGVHFTSALRHPVFVDGANYNGAPNMLRAPALRAMVEEHLAAEVRALPGAMWLPLGQKPVLALKHLVARGVLHHSRLLPALPHPSGANSERTAYFLGRKARTDLSPTTDGAALDAARERLTAAFAATACG
jgi:hypothetical protein